MATNADVILSSLGADPSMIGRAIAAYGGPSVLGSGEIGNAYAPTPPWQSGVPNYGGIGRSNNGFGLNLDTAQLALSGLNTIGSLWGAFEARKLAKKQFAFTKDITETNLANQIQSYNTALEDRSRSRAAIEGQSADQAQSYIDKNRLTR